MPLETKKYQTSIIFFNKILHSNILNLIDITNKEEQIYIKPENEEFKWAIMKSKTQENGYYEIKVEYNNIKYLEENRKTMNNKEYNKKKFTYECYIYDKNFKHENSNNTLSTSLMKLKYDKKKIEFLYNDYWFKEFKVKDCVFFINTKI
jgi:hypothetical protein